MPSTARRRSSIASLRRASASSLRSLKNLLSGKRGSTSQISLEYDGDENVLIDMVRELINKKISDKSAEFDVRDITRINEDNVLIVRFLGEKIKDSGDENEGI